MSLPWEICFTVVEGGGMSECPSNENRAEVSRGRSSEEASVTEVERRAESLEQGSFFLK